MVSGNSSYLWCGKELQQFIDIPWYDSKARFLSTDGVFTSPDPMCEKYYHISPYAYCGGDPVNRVDPEGLDWYAHMIYDEDLEMLREVITYTEATSQEVLNSMGIVGQYMGEAVVVFEGNINEAIGSNGTMLDDDAKAATVTIYGINGKDDIGSYSGLSVSSNPALHSMIAPGDYKMSQQQMATSTYNKNSLNYRIKTLNGALTLPATNGKDMVGVFMHRTNWDGKATNASSGCLVIDGRQWKNVEHQLGKSQNIYLRLTR